MAEKSRIISLELSLKSQIPYILVAVSILTAHLFFRTNDLLVFTSFILLIPFFVILKFDGRIPVAYAILLLILTAFILAFQKNEDLANQVAIYAYWLLVVGVTCLTIEYLRGEVKKKS